MNKKLFYNGLGPGFSRLMRKLTVTGFLLLISALFIQAAQQRTISGTITDESGEPLPGVTIMVRGTTQGTVTNTQGNYSLSVPEDATLLFSFVGMEPQEIAVGNQTVINVTMRTSAIGLDEVVAIGYGTVERRNLTGAVASVRMEGLETRSIRDIGEALTGQIAGVQTVTATGSPGSAPIIRIRGINSITASSHPLIVIDGIPMVSSRDLNVVDPANIESIEVLKDASAASIYGSRANAGVILITTKGARMGDFRVDVSYKSSLQTLPRKVPVMNAQQFIETAKTAAQNAWVYRQGGDPNAPNTVAARGHIRYTWPEEWDDPNVVANWPSTDWQEELYNNAPMHQVNITGSGGTEDFRYSVSGTLLDQQGMMGNDYNRFHLSGRVDNKVNDWFRLGLNVNTRFTDRVGDPTWWVFQHGSIEVPPIYPMWTEDGYAGGPNTIGDDSRYPSTSTPIQNYGYYGQWGVPGYYMNDINRNSGSKVIGTIFAELALTEHLGFRSSYTHDLAWGESSTYNAVDRNMPPGWEQTGSLSRSWSRTQHWYTSNVLNYSRIFGDHNLNLIAGFDAEETQWRGIGASSAGFEHDLTPYLGVASQTNSNNDSESSVSFASYFTRAVYSFRGTYNLNASLRYDGSSKFGDLNKWGVFPSVGLGWIISNEGFMDDAALINDLRLRASYGFTGNDNIGNYAWIPTLGRGTTIIGGQLNTLYQKARLPNPALRWETTGMLNIGFDLGIIDNRINLTADYYRSKTDDLLLSLPISTLTGFGSLMQNIGAVQNQGLELTLNTRNTVGEFNWNTTVTFGRNRGKALDLGGEEFMHVGGASGLQMRVYQEGNRLFEFWSYDYIGTYRDQDDIDNSPSYPGAEPGDAKYRDVTGSGDISPDDRTIIGNPEPDFTSSMTNTFQWRGLDFNVMLTSVVGGDKVNTMLRRTVWWHGGRNMLADIAENAWSPENPDAYRFKPSTQVTPMNTRASSYWLESSTYLKIKNVTLGYNFIPDALRQLGFANFRIYLSAENLYSFDNVTGYDPEQGDRFTHSEYAVPRIFTGGINITL